MEGVFMRGGVSGLEIAPYIFLGTAKSETS